MKKNEKDILNSCETELFSIHSSFAEDMRYKFNIPEFVKLRWLAMRKNVQIAFFCNSLSEWDKITYNVYGKAHTFLDYRELIIKTMKATYLPELEEYYKSKITNFYIFEPHCTEQTIYGFTTKIFEKPLFKSIDAIHAPVEEKLSSSLATYIKKQYGRGPGHTSAAILNNRVLVLVVTNLIAPFPKKFAESDCSAMIVANRMLKSLFEEAVEFACREQYGETFESFFEIDIVENQMIALVLLEPLTEKDLVLD